MAGEEEKGSQGIMPVELTQMRELLLPGLWELTGRYRFVQHSWGGVFGNFEQTMAAPHIWIPKKVAIAAGAAAVIIKNPEITRRFWAGWNRI